MLNLRENHVIMIDTKREKILQRKFKTYILNSSYKCVSETGNMIQKSYIKNSLDTVDYIIVVGSQVNRQTRSEVKHYDFINLKGFALVTKNQNQFT